MSLVKKHRLNQEISIPNVRLINAEGENIGVVDIARAHEIAQEAGYDLVEIVPNAKPPVCRVMDYGKYRFELNKKAQIARKKQKQVQVKEIKFRPGTEKGDYDVKLRKLVAFLNEGDKTKVTIRFRGREMVHKSRGAELLDRVEADLQEISIVEQRPRMEGRQMIMIFAPKKKR